MRTVLAIVGLLGVFGFAASAQTNDKPKTGEVCVLNVSGMFCSACAKMVEKTAKKADGVKSAKVSQPTGTAEITYDPSKTSPDAIAQTITEKTPFKAEFLPARCDDRSVRRVRY
jgi:copper chaperone CopZ